MNDNNTKLQIQIKDGKIFVPLKDKWLIEQPEEKVRQEYICRLVNNYGYELEQMDQEVQVNNSQRGQGRASADIVVWKNKKDKEENNSPLIVVECKAEHITIHEEDYFQGYNYASWAGADFFVTTNQKETRIFKVIKGKIPKTLEEIIDIPDAKTATNQKKIEELLKQTKAFTRDEFSNLLFKCHNIIRNNDKLSPEAAFDEISKILFIKIRYERSNSESQIFSLEAFQKDKESYERYKPKDGKDFYQFLFEQTKEEFKDDHLFEETEIVRIRENSFESIVKELQIYNLSTTSDDVKGIAFEQFLGRTFRGELGQFFTPRTIVDFMVDVLDPQESEVLCDPCCGSGGFLIKAFEYVRSQIEDEIHQTKEQIKEQYYTAEYENLPENKKAEIDQHVNTLFTELNAELDINNPSSRIRELSYDCIFGTDANPRMSRTAKMNMIMHGDGHGGVHHNDGLLNVNGIFENRFDVILTNPPFGSRVEKTLKISEDDKYKDVEKIAKYRKRYGTAYDDALKQITDHLHEPLLNLYETGKMSTLSEVLFIERCLNLLKPGGRMGIVLPEGVLNNTNLQKIREYVESRAKILLIVSLPQDVFMASGATVKTSLLFLKKFTTQEAEQYNEVKEKAGKTINEKYATEKTELEARIATKIAKNLTQEQKAQFNEDKKEWRRQLKELQERIASEVKAETKQAWNYQVPIAEVEKAGISTTGTVIENELVPLAEEFKKYCKQVNLWKSVRKKVKYELVEDKLQRIITLNGTTLEAESFFDNIKV